MTADYGALQVLTTLPSPDDVGFALDFIRRSGADVLFENTPVNYASGQPAIDHLRTALELGMHAITANKGPVVHAYRALTELAASKGRKFYFESAVMDGAPIFSLFRDALPAAHLNAFRGVLNSTTNLILTRMEAGESRLTFAWTALFAALATVNLALAPLATPGGLLLAAGIAPPVTVPLEAWSLFANVLNYLIVGAMFAVEFQFRRRRFPQQSYRGFFDFLRRLSGVSAIFRSTALRQP